MCSIFGKTKAALRTRPPAPEGRTYGGLAPTGVVGSGGQMEEADEASVEGREEG